MRGTVETRYGASLHGASLNGTSLHATSLRLEPDTASATPLPYLLVTAQLFDFRQGGTGAVKHLLHHDLADDVVDLATGEVELRG